MIALSPRYVRLPAHPYVPPFAALVDASAGVAYLTPPQRDSLAGALFSAIGSESLDALEVLGASVDARGLCALRLEFDAVATVNAAGEALVNYADASLLADGYRAARFSLGYDDGVTFYCYTRGESWNGWDVVYIDTATRAALADYIGDDSDDAGLFDIPRNADGLIDLTGFCTYLEDGEDDE